MFIVARHFQWSALLSQFNILAWDASEIKNYDHLVMGGAYRRTLKMRVIVWVMVMVGVVMWGGAYRQNLRTESHKHGHGSFLKEFLKDFVEELGHGRSWSWP